MGAYPKNTMKAFKAGEDLSAKQFSFVKMSADDTIVGCGNDDVPHGILMNAPKSGEDAEVVIDGGAKLKSSGSISRNASIGSAANGQAKAITSGTASAIALEAAVSGDVFAVLFDRHVGRSV